jgi:hypothetical protein
MRDLDLKSAVFGKFNVVDFHAGDKWRCLCECGAVNPFTRADLESERAHCRCSVPGWLSLEKMTAGPRSRLSGRAIVPMNTTARINRISQTQSGWSNEEGPGAKVLEQDPISLKPL